VYRRRRASKNRKKNKKRRCLQRRRCHLRWPATAPPPPAAATTGRRRSHRRRKGGVGERRELRFSKGMKKEKFLFKMNKKGLTPYLYAHPNRFGFLGPDLGFEPNQPHLQPLRPSAQHRFFEPNPFFYLLHTPITLLHPPFTLFSHYFYFLRSFKIMLHCLILFFTFSVSY